MNVFAQNLWVSEYFVACCQFYNSQLSNILIIQFIVVTVNLQACKFGTDNCKFLIGEKVTTKPKID